MMRFRTHGSPPFTLAVLHGGPGAPGEAAPVARELGREWGALEPLQTATTLEGQVQELRAVLREHAALPVALIGHSWGAMLGFIVSARYPELVDKLILVGSAVFDGRHASAIAETRLSRLAEGNRGEARSLMDALNDPAFDGKGRALAQLGRLFATADAFDPLPDDGEVLEVRAELYQRVWREAAALRANGGLLELGRSIRCPVVAIHGDHDPHPAAGVREPLAAVLADFRFVLLEHCGHKPWLERRARGEFFRVLRDELRRGPARGV